MFWFLQTQLCTSSLTPYPLATPSFLPVSISHAFGFPVLFPCIANVGFLLWFFSIIYFRSKAVSISEQKKENKVGFWRAAPPKSHRVADQKRCLSSARSGGHISVWSLWLSDLLSMVFGNTFLPALPRCYQEHRPTCGCVYLEDDFALLLSLQLKESFLLWGRSLLMLQSQRGDEELSTVVTQLIKCHNSVGSIGLSPVVLR